MKFSSNLKKINFKSHKSMLKTGAILFWTDMKRLFNWNMDNFKSNFLSRVQLRSKSNDKFFLSVLKMWQCCKYFFGNLIFALTARTLSGNRLKCQFWFHTYNNRPTCSRLSACFVPGNLCHLLREPDYHRTSLASSHQHHTIWCKRSTRTTRPSFHRL